MGRVAASRTLPVCLQQRGVLALLLVCVDDLICGTNNEAWKVLLFAELNTKYGIKDQGRLHSYLGVQVDLTEKVPSCTKPSTPRMCSADLILKVREAAGPR